MDKPTKEELLKLAREYTDKVWGLIGSDAPGLEYRRSSEDHFIKHVKWFLENWNPQIRRKPMSEKQIELGRVKEVITGMIKDFQKTNAILKSRDIQLIYGAKILALEELMQRLLAISA